MEELFSSNPVKVKKTSFVSSPRNLFLRDVLLAWNNLTSKTVIYNYGNEVVWNNSNIRVENKTIIFKNWQQSGIKYVKDMFDNDRQSFYTFAALKKSLIYHRSIILNIYVS